MNLTKIVLESLEKSRERSEKLRKTFDLFFAVIIVAGAIGIIYYIVGYGGSRIDVIANTSDIATSTSPFSELKLEAKAVYIMNSRTGEDIFALNSEQQLPLASLTKVMTAITALRLVPDFTLITVNSEDLFAEGDSGLYAEDSWLLKDIISLTLLESSNDGAMAIAGALGAFGTTTIQGNQIKPSEIFVSKMNETAKQIGLKNMFFVNPTGLDESEIFAGGYGGAKDVSTMMLYAIKNYPKILESTKFRKATFISEKDSKVTANNTNTIVNEIPGLIASKTGYTKLAGGNLVIAFDAGFANPYIITILGSTEKGRFEDAKKLVQATLKYIAEE